jgi:hypothetical protein
MLRAMQVRSGKPVLKYQFEGDTLLIFETTQF